MILVQFWFDDCCNCTSKCALLGNKVKRSMLNLLKDIRLSIGMMNFYKPLSLVNKCLIAVDAEVFP